MPKNNQISHLSPAFILIAQSQKLLFIHKVKKYEVVYIREMKMTNDKSFFQFQFLIGGFCCG